MNHTAPLRVLGLDRISLCVCSQEHYRAFFSRLSQGLEDEILESSLGRWADTVATYCPGRPSQIVLKLMRKPRREKTLCRWSKLTPAARLGIMKKPTIIKDNLFIHLCNCINIHMNMKLTILFFDSLPCFIILFCAREISQKTSNKISQTNG